MPSQNQYQQTAVPVDGGLDLINPKISIAGGSISGGLNFERTDRVGLSRILGNEQFDGGALASLCYTNLAVITHTPTGLNTPCRSAIWVIEDDGTDGPVLGFVATSNSTTTDSVIVVTNFDEWRRLQTLLPSAVLGCSFGTSYTVSAITAYDAWYRAQQVDPTTVDAAELTIARNSLFILMKNTLTVPGDPAKPVIGLHGYKEQVYAIKDLSTVWFHNGNSEVFANDIIEPNGDITPDRDIHILDVHLVSGKFVDGDAAGFLLIDVKATPPYLSYDITKPTSRVNNALALIATPGGNDASPWAAGLYRSNSYDQSQEFSVPEGWSSVDLGFEMDFIDGQSNGPFRIARRGDFSDFDTDIIEGTGTGTTGSTSDSLNGVTPIATDTWTLTGSGTVPGCLEGDSLDTFVRRTINNAVGNTAYTPGNCYISNFPAFSGFSGASSLDILGVEITVAVRPQRTNFGIINTFSVAVQPVVSDTSLMPGTGPQQAPIEVNYNSPAQTVQHFTFGGPTDLWGLDAAAMKSNMDAGFGFAIQPWVQIIDGQRQGIIDILYAQVKVYYKATVSAYYFYNGVDDLTADITGYFVATGDWSTNDAAGTMQVTNVQPYLTANRRAIMAGDEIRTDPNGAGLLVATVGIDDMAFNGLDTLDELQDHTSRYEIITANFYADAEFEAMYGVSGAGRAFSWDGFYFTRIYTQEDADKDMPRHILDHQFHLALGYNSGAVLLSALGNPQDFSGVDGAAEIDTGDPVTGMIRMNGTTLGVFCKKSIQGIVGTSVDNFSLTVLSPYEGAIEYTVLDIGRPVYCSYRGISLFDQTAAYGDFAGNRLSTPVSPWLLPRLQGTISPIGTTASSLGPVVAIACRTKNQYRLYFGDGYQLVMTLVFSQGGQAAPQFTFRADGLYNDVGLLQTYLVPRAETSFVDDAGTEHVYLAHYSTSSTPPNNSYGVYEYERSWTFDGAGIPAYFILNENFYGSLFEDGNLRKIRVEGMSLGYALMTVHVESNFAENDSTNQNPRLVIPINLPRDPNASLATDYIPVTNICNVMKSGSSFNYRFMSYVTTGQPDDAQDPTTAIICPPFIVQGLLIQNIDTKGDV